MELIIVLAVALLVLGPKRLPQAGRSLGQGLREFKDGLVAKPTEAAADAPRLDAPNPE
jgi:sec-independent protein translocase protein TatA